MDNRLTQNT